MRELTTIHGVMSRMEIKTICGGEILTEQEETRRMITVEIKAQELIHVGNDRQILVKLREAGIPVNGILWLNDVIPSGLLIREFRFYDAALVYTWYSDEEVVALGIKPKNDETCRTYQSKDNCSAIEWFKRWKGYCKSFYQRATSRVGRESRS